MPRIVEFDKPSYDVVRAVVGGLVQHVPDFHEYNGKRCEVFCNEEGLLLGLELNVEATTAWRTYLQKKYPGQWDPEMAHLVGDIVIAYGGMK